MTEKIDPYLPDVAKIAAGLSEADKDVLRDWSDFQIGRWLLRRMAIFSARQQGRTAIGTAFRRTYLMETNNE